MRRRRRRACGSISLEVDFLELGVPKRTGCAFGGGPGPPYRPLLNSDNGNQPAMSSGRQGGAPPGGPKIGGSPGGSPGPRIVRGEGGHRG